MENADGTGEITRLLASWRRGETDAVDRLFTLVYDELQSIARLHRRRQGAENTLSTTEVVHETYLKLSGARILELEDRQHFFAVASKAMRRLLIDRARRRRTQKRDGRRAVLDEERLASGEHDPESILALEEALSRLEAVDARLAETVELRFYAGLSVEEVAALQSVSLRTVKRDWHKARAFLLLQMRSEA